MIILRIAGLVYRNGRQFYSDDYEAAFYANHFLKRHRIINRERLLSRYYYRVPIILIMISLLYLKFEFAECRESSDIRGELVGSPTQAMNTHSSTSDINQNQAKEELNEVNNRKNSSSEQEQDKISDYPSSAEVSGPAPMLFFDEDISEDDEGEEEEDEEDFYSKNPVQLSEDFDLGSDIKVSNSDFKDFDDHEALKESKLHQNNKTYNGKIYDDDEQESGGRDDEIKLRDRKLIGASSREMNESDKYRGEASNNNFFANLQQQCSVVLERGLCITYGTVEWAARRARRLLQFERPDDLNSREPSESSINSVGELNELTTRILAQRFQLTWLEVALELSQIDVSRTSLWRSCPALYRTQAVCLSQSRYRTHTGQCNNLEMPNFGSSYMPFLRFLPADYSDGVGSARRSSLTGNELPPARLLALSLHPDIKNPSSDLSVLFMSWGQLINHDLAMASGARVATGHSSACCGPRYDPICMPIQVGHNDPVYGPHRIRCLDFKRSLAGLRPGCTLGPRIQMNTITSFIDASFVYGSTRTMSAALRRNSRGLLSTRNYFRNLKPLLPPQVEAPDEECVGRRSNRFCFLSGDARTNQQIQLTALHTIHTRQHNRLAQALEQLNPHWSDNRIYHEARHIHIALVQHILLNEYLPLLLGEQLLAKYNLKESPPGHYWDQYDSSLNPSISQAFAAAAFRQGHTSVPSEVFRFNSMHELTRVYQLRSLFRQPWPLYEPGALDEFLLGMLDAPAQSFDPFVSEELSGHLLQEPGELVGSDLVAINIQRGRDQGVAGYNAFREWCGLKRLTSFEQLTDYMNNRTSFLMSQLYESVDDIDLFTGGISEFPLEGAQVGETFACIIGRQFEQLRAADRFWFESSLGPQAFTMSQLESIKQVSLARLICINSDWVITIQQIALQQAHPVLNPRLHCAELTDLDITLWQELVPA